MNKRNNLIGSPNFTNLMLVIAIFAFTGFCCWFKVSDRSSQQQFSVKAVDLSGKDLNSN